jgi:hypothetical protein
LPLEDTEIDARRYAEDDGAIKVEDDAHADGETGGYSGVRGHVEIIQQINHGTQTYL